MLHGIADSHTEPEHQDLGNRVECCSKEYIANGPSVFQGPEDENELRDYVDHGANQWPEDVYNPESNGLCILESRELLEGGDSEEESDAKDDKN